MRSTGNRSWRGRGVIAATVVACAASMLAVGISGAAEAHAAAPHVTAAPHFKGTYTICEVDANSGSFSFLGNNDELGATAWAKDINKAGGLDGYKVVLVKEDDETNPALAASLVRKCVSQVHANVIWGPEETATMATAVPVADDLHMFLMTMGSGWAGQGIPNNQLDQTSFPAVDNVFYADDLATFQYLIDPQHLKRVAVIQDDSPGGLGNGAYTTGLCKVHGCKVVSTQTIPTGEPDPTPAVLSMLAANPQIIVLGLIPGEPTFSVLNAIRAQNPNIPISECSGCTTSSFISSAGGVTGMHNIYSIGGPYSTIKLPATGLNVQAIAATKAYIAGMKEAGLGSADDVNAGGIGWDAGVELQAAVKAAGTINSPAVEKALRTQSVVTGGDGQALFWNRNAKHYDTIAHIITSMVTITSGDGQKVYTPPNNG
ncbi:MAG TPA: ABC transporter substrate-binding protein [Acidimicrobiales bacterium]